MTPPAILHRDCQNHRGREAAAFCADCRKPFCRECVIEHEDQVLCALCVSSRAPDKPAKKFSVLQAFIPLASLISFFLLWLLFYGLAYLLILIPATFHDGLFWNRFLWG